MRSLTFQWPKLHMVQMQSGHVVTLAILEPHPKHMAGSVQISPQICRPLKSGNNRASSLLPNGSITVLPWQMVPPYHSSIQMYQTAFTESTICSSILSQYKRVLEEGKNGGDGDDVSTDACRTIVLTVLTSSWMRYGTYCPAEGAT